MKVKTNQEVETAHAWVDEEGKVQHCVLRFNSGEEVDSEDMSCGDAIRCLGNLVRLGYAEEL